MRKTQNDEMLVIQEFTFFVFNCNYFDNVKLEF